MRYCYSWYQDVIFQDSAAADCDITIRAEGSECGGPSGAARFGKALTIGQLNSQPNKDNINITNINNRKPQIFF